MTTTSHSTSQNPAQTTAEQLEFVLQSAADAARPWAAIDRSERAAALESVADALEDAGPQLIPVGVEETHLPEGRLQGELKRTAFQLRLFGEMLRDGTHLDVRIDHPDPDWPMGAHRPDLRRGRFPIGPVLVFAASNFPFAFSVAGGDTASALAAGNPVVVKAHAGHPRLSELTSQVVVEALAAAGAPQGTFSLIFGRESGTAAVQDRRIRAAGFTGSITGGRALFDLAAARPDPIPFYGELGSNNPVFVTPSAAESRGQEIVDGFLASFTAGAGQFCTKPGTLFVPEGSGLVENLGVAELPATHALLNPSVESGYDSALQALVGHDAVQILSERVGSDDGLGSDERQPVLLHTTADALLADPEALEAECFGPTALVVEYPAPGGSLQEAARVAETFEGQLTATVFGEDDESVQALLAVLAEVAGRVIWNQWPTGVSVTYAQQHGGPYPATTAPTSTSVGTAAIERFQRPVAYQNLPHHLLPADLRD